MRKFTRLSATVLGLGMLAVLAGCDKEPLTQCEPGVGAISQMGAVTPPPGC